MMDYEQQQEMLSALIESKKYIKQAHDNAEAKHDSYGDYHMDGGMYEIMQETEALLARIDAAIDAARSQP